MNVTAAAADDDYANHVSNLANGAAHFIQKAFDFLFLLPAICTSILKVDPPPQEMIFFEIEFYRPPDKSPLALPCSLSMQAHREWALLREWIGWAGLPPPLGPTPFSLLPSWADPFRRTSQVFPRLPLSPPSPPPATTGKLPAVGWPTKRQCSPQVGAQPFPLLHRPHNVNIHVPISHPFLSFLIRNKLLSPLFLFILLLLILTRMSSMSIGLKSNTKSC